MYPNPTNNLRRVLWPVIIIVVLLLLGWWFYTYLTTGKLVIATDKDNQVTVSQLNGKVVSQQTGGIAVKLHAGQYLVSVHSKVLSTNQTIEVKGRQTVRKTIHTKPALTIQPVTGMNAQDIRATSGGLTFLNPDDGSVNTIDTANNLGTLAGAGQYRSIKWLNLTTAILQSDAGYLYQFQNNQVQPLSADQSALHGVVNDFSIAPDHTVYVAVGNDIYKGSDGHYQRLYAGSSLITAVYAAAGRVAFLTTKTGGSDHPETTATIRIASASGQATKGLDISVNDALTANFSVAWSPNGQQLVVANSGSVGSVYDDSLQKQYDLPGDTVTSVAWQSNTELYYASNNLLWSFHTPDRTAYVVANASTGNTIAALAVDDSASNVYFTVNNGETTALSRVNLRGQTLSDSAYQLAAFFPADLGVCSVNYANFTYPVLVATYSGDPGDCQSQLTETLNGDGLTIDGIQVRYVQQS